MPFFNSQLHREVALNVSTVGKFWAQKYPELWLPILCSGGPWIGVSENLDLGLLSSQPQAPLGPAGLENKNFGLTGPVLLGAVGAGLFKALSPDLSPGDSLTYRFSGLTMVLPVDELCGGRYG